MGRCNVAERTMKPGGRSPKNRSISRSVTRSYFAPPMPWMNRSPRASRAQSVVTSARERIRTPPRCSSSSRSTARPASPSARSGSRASHDCRSESTISPPAASGEKPPAAGLVGRPDPQRGLQPSPLLGQLGHRMRKAADVMRPPILAHRLVVDGAKLRQPGQQMRREPLERLARTYASSAGPPASPVPKKPLQLMTGLGQAGAEVVGLLRPGANQRPVLRDQADRPPAARSARPPAGRTRRTARGPRSAAPRRGFSGRAGRRESARRAARRPIRRARAARRRRACRCRRSD